MKKALIILFSLVVTFQGFGQQDSKAKEILSKVTEKTKGYQSIEATFSFVMNNVAENIQENNKGTIVLKGNKYKVRIPDMGLEIYCDGSSIWTYLQNANEVNISTLDEDADNLMNPSRIFTIYERGFNSKYVGESVVDGIPVYSIDLIPENDEMEIEQIRIIIDKQKMLVRSAEMKGKDGNNYHVSIDQFKTDIAYPDTAFVFDPAKHEGVQVVDMRY